MTILKWWTMKSVQHLANAAKRRGLLHDDTEYVKCMDEAATFQMPQQLRMLFCMILIHCNPTDPIDLWNSYKAHMAEDFMNSTDADTAEAMVFHAIEGKLNEKGVAALSSVYRHHP